MSETQTTVSVLGVGVSACTIGRSLTQPGKLFCRSHKRFAESSQYCPGPRNDSVVVVKRRTHNEVLIAEAFEHFDDPTFLKESEPQPRYRPPSSPTRLLYPPSRSEGKPPLVTRGQRSGTVFVAQQPIYDDWQDELDDDTDEFDPLTVHLPSRLHNCGAAMIYGMCPRCVNS